MNSDVLVAVHVVGILNSLLTVLKHAISAENNIKDESSLEEIQGNDIRRI